MSDNNSQNSEIIIVHSDDEISSSLDENIEQESNMIFDLLNKFIPPDNMHIIENMRTPENKIILNDENISILQNILNEHMKNNDFDTNIENRQYDNETSHDEINIDSSHSNDIDIENRQNDNETSHDNEILIKNDSENSHDNEIDNNFTETDPNKKKIPTRFLKNRELYDNSLRKQLKTPNNKSIVDKNVEKKNNNLKMINIGGKIRFINNTPIEKKQIINENREKIPEKYLKNQEKYNNLNKKKLPTNQSDNKIHNQNEESKIIKVNGKYMNLGDENEDDNKLYEKNKKYLEDCGLSQRTKPKMPKKYARYVDTEIKKHTMNNLKDIKELRKMNVLKNIDIDDMDIKADISKLSLDGLRRINNEQRQKNIKTEKQLSSWEQDIQNILNDPKRSKLSKTIAIKNLNNNRFIERKKQ